MKKLITISILSAALAASSAFAFGNNDRGRDNGRSAGGNEGTSIQQIFIKQNVVSQKQSDNIAQALFFINERLAANSDVKFVALNVEQNKRSNLWSLVAKYDGRAEKISAEDLAAASKEANNQLGGETVTASDGMYFAMANISSEDRSPVLVVKVHQKRNEITIAQVASDDAKATALIQKITDADHSNLDKIVAKQEGGRSR